MTTDTEIIQPVPLRTFLEYGGDPREVLGDGWANLEQYVTARTWEPTSSTTRA